MAVPEFDWSRLREQFPDEFEGPVGSSVSPADWVMLRIAVQERTIQVYVWSDKMPVLTARKLGNLNQGIIGLWTGNNSDGDFRNLRITPAG